MDFPVTFNWKASSEYEEADSICFRYNCIMIVAVTDEGDRADTKMMSPCILYWELVSTKQPLLGSETIEVIYTDSEK